jgi:hypothetical protein
MQKNALACISFVFVLLVSCSQPESSTTPLFVERFKNGTYPSSSHDADIDTYLNQYYPTTSYAGIQYDTVGNLGGYSNRTLMRFELSYLEQNTLTVEKAYLTMTIYIAASGVTVGCFNAPSAFTAASTWNTYPIAAVDPTLTAISPAYDLGTQAQGKTITFSLDPTHVQQWIDDPSTNKGIILKNIDESTVDKFVHFWSMDSSSIAYAPCLTVVYSFK